MADAGTTAGASKTTLLTLVRDVTYQDEVYPAGTNLDPTLEWVARCIVPLGSDVSISQEAYDLTRKLEAELAKVESELAKAPTLKKAKE